MFLLQLGERGDFRHAAPSDRTGDPCPTRGKMIGGAQRFRPNYAFASMETCRVRFSAPGQAGLRIP